MVDDCAKLSHKSQKPLIGKRECQLARINRVKLIPKHPITKDNTMSITSQALKIGAMLLLTAGFSQLLPNPAQAQYSDYYSNKRAAEASRARTSYYGGSYGQAANAYQNRRYGSGAAQYYNPNYYGSGATTNQSANCQNLAQGYYSATNQTAKNIAAQVYNQYCSH
jgi:hypothetical protein